MVTLCKRAGVIESVDHFESAQDGNAVGTKKTEDAHLAQIADPHNISSNTKPVIISIAHLGSSKTQA